jgi:hypothetical protein
MLPQVKLVGKLEVDIKFLLSDLRLALGRIVSEPLDRVSADPNTPASLLVVLCEMLQQGRSYHKVLQNPGSSIKHLFFMFLALSSRDHSSEFYQHSRLSCFSVPARKGIFLHLISGNLEEWHSAIINGCSDIVEQDYRLLMNKFLFEFDSIGLRDLWSQFSRQQSTDETIRLIGYKK